MSCANTIHLLIYFWAIIFLINTAPYKRDCHSTNFNKLLVFILPIINSL